MGSRLTQLHSVLTLLERNLLTAMMLWSLLMTGYCGSRGVDAQLCPKDQFYDAVVGECALCSDVCDLCRVPESRVFCSQNCREYYAEMVKAGTHCAVVPSMKAPLAVIDQDDDAAAVQSATSWSSNPLIWTTIISLSIAIVATATIVTLVVFVQMRQRCAAKTPPGERLQSNAYTAVEAGIVSPQTTTASTIYCPGGFKEKSDPLLMSGVY